MRTPSKSRESRSNNPEPFALRRQRVFTVKKMPNFGVRVSLGSVNPRPFPGKKKNITSRFLNRGRPLVAHCPERTPSRDSSERRRRRFERGRLVRTTRDRIFSLRTSQGDPSRSIRRNFPRLAGRDFFHVLLPRRRRGRDRSARARTPCRRALTPRRCAQDQRPDAPGTRLRHPEPSIPPPPRSELPPPHVRGCGRRDNLLRGASRGFWRPTTRTRVEPRGPSSSRPRARRDVGVITPAPPTRDVAPKSTRSQLTGSLPRSHPPRVTLGSLARINARRC